MRMEYFLFIHHTTSILEKLSTWCFEHSGDISCFLLDNPSHTDESWKGRSTCLWIYALNLFIEHSGEHWWEWNIFCSFTTPQAFWQNSAPGALSTLVTSVALHSLTRSTLTSPRNDETRVCIYIYNSTTRRLWYSYISILTNLLRTEFVFVKSYKFGLHMSSFVFSRKETTWKLITCTALGVRLPWVSNKDLLYDIFVLITNIKIVISTDDVLFTSNSKISWAEATLIKI